MGGGQGDPGQQQSQPNVGMQIGNVNVHAQNPQEFQNWGQSQSQMAGGAYPSAQGR